MSTDLHGSARVPNGLRSAKAAFLHRSHCGEIPQDEKTNRAVPAVRVPGLGFFRPSCNPHRNVQAIRRPTVRPQDNRADRVAPASVA